MEPESALLGTQVARPAVDETPVRHRAGPQAFFFPLAIEELDPDLAKRVIEAHFDRENEFGAPFPIPSVEMRDAAFFGGETPFIWRGPAWAPTNWFFTTR